MSHVDEVFRPVRIPKPHPTMISVLPGEIPYSCAKILCSAEIIPCFVE